MHKAATLLPCVFEGSYSRCCAFASQTLAQCLTSCELLTCSLMCLDHYLGLSQLVAVC